MMVRLTTGHENGIGGAHGGPWKGGAGVPPFRRHSRGIEEARSTARRIVITMHSRPDRSKKCGEIPHLARKDRVRLRGMFVEQG
jgi:hypothetical protein